MLALRALTTVHYALSGSIPSPNWRWDPGRGGGTPYDGLCKNRVWKGLCVIRDSAENQHVIREYRENPAVIREFCVCCDVGFSLSVVLDS